MKNKFLLFLCSLLLSPYIIRAQYNDRSTLLTIDDRQISRGEFVRIYKKNNTNPDMYDPAKVEEYLQLFINFKLRVLEAEKRGLDQSPSFKAELNNYRQQLTKPYMTDESVIDSLVVEAYERMKYEVRASHILITVDHDAPPQDTAIAYKKALSIRDRIIKGESFATVAAQSSDDPGSKDREGDLGYFSAFRMVYPFESYCFKADLNKISMPVRSRFGYHIIKVTDRREARGEIKVGHIMKVVPQGTPQSEADSIKQLVLDIQQKLKNGEDFAKIAETYSDDRSTSMSGGELPWFGAGRMIPVFEEACFGLKANGDISEPVQTTYGWHIIKRLDYKPLQPFDQLKSDLKGRVTRDERAQKSREAVVTRLKKEYGFKQLSPVSDFYSAVDSTIFLGGWNISKAAHLRQPLFSLGDTTVNQKDFALYIQENADSEHQMAIPNFVEHLYKEYQEFTITQYEENRLENKYDDFRYLMQEYHDGILLFELTDSMVWSRAVKDTAGLESFFNQNRNNYMWDKRYDISVFKCVDANWLKKTEKLVIKKPKKKYSDDDILKQINTDTIPKVQLINSGSYQKGDNPYSDMIFAGKLDEKAAYHVLASDNTIVLINKVLEPQPKQLAEARGLVTADYQNYLEKQWITDLRTKYTIKINDDVLKSIR